MSILDLFRRAPPAAPSGEAVTHSPMAQTFAMQSPEYYEFLRNGGSYGVNEALKNSAVLRAVDLTSGIMGALPCRIIERRSDGRIVEAETHPLYDLLMFAPNSWQTAFEFRQLMQAWVLIHGNAYARIVRGVGGRVVSLLPIEPPRVDVRQLVDGSLQYTVSSTDGRTDFNPPQEDIFHLRGVSMDGIKGVSRVKQAADVIHTALQAQRAANRLFSNGVIGGMALEHPAKLTPEAAKNLKDDIAAYNAGAENAGKTMVLQEGMKRSFAPANAETLQLVELRGALVEEIARIFGVPRPLMMVEETSWGSGIEQLAILFVRFGLAPWFVAWEQAVERALMSTADRRRFKADYDERELLRGTLKDQAEYFAKALGAGGHRPWMEANEVREVTGLGLHRDGSGLIAAGESRDVASQAAR
jgi:HK97 family phage portal protein